MISQSSLEMARSCGKETHLAEQMPVTQLVIHVSAAHFVTSQPGVFTGVELVSRAANISRKRRNWETRRRQSNSCKRTEREVKRNLVAQPEISHDAAEQILRSHATRTDENFPGIIHVSHQLFLLHGHANVFFCNQCGAVNAGGTLRLLKSLCDGTGESRQKARRKLEHGLMPNEHVTADANRAFQLLRIFSLTLLDVSTHRASSISLVIF